MNAENYDVYAIVGELTPEQIKLNYEQALAVQAKANDQVAKWAALMNAGQVEPAPRKRGRPRKPKTE
jgi:hypothetical protein